MRARSLILKLSTMALILFVFISCSELTEADGLDAHPAIWKLDNGSAQVYLIGSIHLLPPELKWYGGKIKKILDIADEVVFEVHMTSETQEQARAITVQNGMLRNGDKLSNYITKDEYDFLKKITPELGISIETITNFQPWFASIALSVSAVINEGWDPEAGVDRYIQKIATQRQLKITDLETIEVQMEALYNHPLDVQANMLKDTISELEDIQKLTLEMINVWSSGNEIRLVDIFLEPMREQSELYAKIITSRNKNWVPRLEEFFKKKQVTIVIVGTAHLIGDGGVVELLRQKGYDINRVQ